MTNSPFKGGLQADMDRDPLRDEIHRLRDDVDDLHAEIRLAVEALDSWMEAGKLPGNLVMVIERLRSLLPQETEA